MPAARPNRLLACTLGGALVIALGTTLPSDDARADCQPDAPIVGDTVICNDTGGTDLDGFDAGGVDGIDVDVESTAIVENGGVAGTSAITVGDNNTVTVDSGAAINATGDGSHAIEIGSNNNSASMGATTEDGVINNGSLSATGNSAGGILGVDDNAVTNNGNIVTGDTGAATNAFGIRLGDDAEVTNNVGGAILVTGDGAIGIQVGTDTMTPADPLDEEQNVFNQGTVTVSAEAGTGTGVRIGNDNEVTNNNRIEVNIDDGGNAIGLEMGDGNTVGNNGTIQVNKGDPISPALPAGSATAVQMNGVDTGDTEPSNELSNSGLIEANGPEARAIVVTGEDNTIINQQGGIIRVEDDGGPAIDLSGAAVGVPNTIENDGRITAPEDDLMNAGVAILGGAGVEEITLGSSSSVTGEILLGGGNDIVTLNPGTAISNLVDGEGGTNELRLHGTGAGTLDLDLIQGFDSLDLDETMGGTAGGSGFWVFTGADVDATQFSGGAVIENGTVGLQESVGIDGDVTFRNDSALLIDLDPANGTNGRLNLSDDTLTFDGMDTDLLVTFASPLITDQTFTILDVGAGGSIVGAFGTTPADTPLLTFNLMPAVGGQVDLEILRASYGVVAETSNQGEVGSYLDRVLQASGNSDNVENLLLGLDFLDEDELRTVYDSLQPEAYDAHTSSMVNLGRAFADAAARPRLLCKPPFVGLDPGPHQDIPCGRTGFTAWVRLLFSEWDRDAGSDFFNSDGSHQAIAGGFDWRPDRRVQFTGYIGIGSADLDVEGLGDLDGELQTFEIGTAVHARLGGARIRAAFGYGRGNHEQDRELRINGADVSVEGEYDSNRIHGLAEFGWLFEFGNFQIEPLAGLDVTWIAEDAFDEEGGTRAIELDVDERENVLVSTEFGGRFLYRHHQSAYSDTVMPLTQGTWTPEVSARWRSTWVGADREIDARFSGAGSSAGDFTVDAEDSEQGVDVGARVTFQPHGSGGSFSIGYDGFFGDKGTNHRFGADVEIFF